MDEHRQTPETSLLRAHEEEGEGKRGKLKIYLGAAPGVGKTYAMLQDAIAQRAQGLDVVIGIVESHGRVEIEGLLNKLDIIPRQQVLYHDKELREFDLDAALDRHPGLILLDEMAHTNAPGLRHAKRWQDIKELLDRGINVFTTLNVQHIESLTDDVSQIIHAPIKETVPDIMIEMAHTIELIDLPPEDLLKRLKEGKVYLPEQARIAEEYYFRKGNLIALRELALRKTAEQVGAQVLLYRRGQGIQHIWPTREKILVCVGPGTESSKLIRAARRMAASLQTEWMAVYVDRPILRHAEEIRNKAILNLRLAEQLGAETRVLTGFDIVKEIMAYAREKNATLIMTWKHIRTRWRDFIFRNLADEIVRHSKEIDVYIMTGTREKEIFMKRVAPRQPLAWKYYLISVGIVFLATTINFFLSSFLGNTNFIMVYLLGVAIVGLFGRIGPSLLTTISSVLAYDFFFVPPYYSFEVEDWRYLATMAMFLLVAQFISILTILSYRQTESSRSIEQQTATLHILSRRLAIARGTNGILEISVKYIAEVFDSDVLALVLENNQWVIHANSSLDEKKLNEKESGVMSWVFEHGQMAGFGTETLPFAKALYLPMVASEYTVGVLQLTPKPEHLYTMEEMHLLEACAYQIALAVEVDRLHAVGGSPH